MIKKAVLPLLTAPFLMVFSSYAFSEYLLSSFSSWTYRGGGGMTYAECGASVKSKADNYAFEGSGQYPAYTVDHQNNPVDHNPSRYEGHCAGSYGIYPYNLSFAIADGAFGIPYTDEDCQNNYGGDSIPISPSSANYLNSGGSVSAAGGACSVTGAGGVMACSDQGEGTQCTMTLVSSSTGEIASHNNNDIDLISGTEGTFSVADFSHPEYLNELPGGCSDPSSCVTIGDTSYLVDWDSAPDYFSYVDSSGTVHSKSSSGGGGGDNGGSDTGGGGDDNPTDPTDPGGDTGGGDSGGDTGGDDSDDDNGGGGGSTVPDFEFDESGIIAAIGSAGQSNQAAIDAASSDITGAIGTQTNNLNTATSAQTDALNSTLNSQTDSLTNSLDDQTDDLTTAISDQTGILTGSLDALGTTFTDALNSLGLGSVGDDTGDGEGEGGEGDGLVGSISDLLNGMVDNLANTFTEDLGSGDDLFNSTGLDDTLDGVAAQEEQHSDDVNTLMDEIGEGATSGIADQITSRFPSLPSGGCTPLQFGPMEISCQAFNTIKLWLTWIIYFWTVVSIIDTFFRSEQRTA